jgi:hypothetical protein
MKRREFIAVVASAAATWPFSARGQRPPAMPRVGYLSPGLGPSSNLNAFKEGLRELGLLLNTGTQREGLTASLSLLLNSYSSELTLLLRP